MIYADQRWIGNHGIGRFARHVLPALDYSPVSLTSNPAAPLDALRLARALGKLTSSDLFFSPGYNTPLYCSAPFIFTIHDLSHVYCAENTSLAIQLYYATIMKRACRRAAKILTVSEFTRGQIIAWSGVSPQKVFNVGCGVDAAYKPEGDSYGLPFQYLLCVSNRKPHKNEFRVVEAFAKARLDPEIHLVFTGNVTPELDYPIKKHSLQSRVQFVGMVPEEKLPALYRGAEALIFPSLYEGFGLPVLEAMACGTPVVTSKVTALPEIAGDATVLVDPTSIEEIAGATGKIVNDTSLRSQLREKGLARARKFSWAHTAAHVCRLVEVIIPSVGIANK
ncbi:MAG TPA: glycosyltransferase family 1 protein [Candidatus Aquilonibacter sp.]|jgi:glycosyltransferase involved in cell wall biosynthesis|nr:glycosyltransferase family 1 protein [Candidatus Aquilonibacter sp.]